MAFDSSKLKTAIKKRMTDELGFDFSKATQDSSTDIIIEEILKHIAEEGEVNVKLTTGLNTVFASGVPAPPDGGTALQAAWIAATLAGIADNSKGTIK